MIVCPKYKTGFIHIYKTGGTSLTLNLSDHTIDGLRGSNPGFEGDGWQGTWHLNQQQHSKFKQNANALREIIDDQWRFIVVCREPYDWFSSVFYEFYHIDRGWKSDFNFLFGKISRNRTFEDYIDFFRDFRPGYPNFWGFSTQKSFIEGIPKDRLHMIRFENYEESVKTTLQELGFPISKVRHELKRGAEKTDFRSYLKMHPKFIAFVNEVFQEDFEFFGYEMLSNK